MRRGLLLAGLLLLALMPITTEVEAGPIAAFEWSPAIPLLGQTIQFNDLSGDTNGSIVSWNWDFGDGNTSVDPGPFHAFQAKNSYQVSLNVTDNNGYYHVATRTIVISNEAPTANFTSDGTLVAGEPVNFTGTENDPDGSIGTRTWDFDDGHGATIRYPQHVFAAEGSYDVSYTVIDDDGASASITRLIVITAAPIIPPAEPFSNFTIQDEGYLFQHVAFSDLSTGTIDRWVWDFGDGTLLNTTDAIEARAPTHTYGQVNTYTISLTVYNLNVSNTSSLDLEVTQAPPPPPRPISPAFVFHPTAPEIGEAVVFVDTSDGDIDTWTWNFSDSSTDIMAPTAFHTYDSIGSHNITLVLTGPGGSQTLTRSLTVSAASDGSDGVGGEGGDEDAEVDRGLSTRQAVTYVIGGAMGILLILGLMRLSQKSQPAPRPRLGDWDDDDDDDEEE